MRAEASDEVMELVPAGAENLQQIVAQALSESHVSARPPSPSAALSSAEAVLKVCGSERPSGVEVSSCSPRVIHAGRGSPQR